MNDSLVDPDFDYEGFARRLAEAIAPEKITHFAERVGVPQGTLSKYLKGVGTGPRVDIAAKLARGAKVSLDWLVSGRGDGPVGASSFVVIPRFDVQLAAGAGAWNEGRRQLDEIPFTADFLRKVLGRSSTKGLAIVTARGDSMEPTIADRAIVLVDEEDTRLIDGVFAFLLDGDARVKRFRKLTDGVQIISDNAAYPIETIMGKDQRKLQIIGRLLWVGQLV